MYVERGFYYENFKVERISYLKLKFKKEKFKIKYLAIFQIFQKIK